MRTLRYLATYKMNSDDDRFDGLYLNVAQTTRGIEPLLDTVFSFLRRKTDFFSGPPGSGDGGTEKAIEKVNEVLLKHAELWRKSQNSNAKAKPSSQPKRQPAKVDASSARDNDDVVEIGSDGKFDVSGTLSAAKDKSESTASTQSSVHATEDKVAPESANPDHSEHALPTQSTDDVEKEDKDDSEERKPPPPGNGGTVPDKYVWTQILSEVVVTIPVHENTRGRDLNVVISKSHLKVALLSPSPKTLVDADLTKSVICDDSFWTVEDGCRLVINLQKLNTMEWWDSVCQGDPKIDVRTVQPENSSLSTSRVNAL
jgi:CS domain/N-terminal conserved domain of Nudc.